MASILGVLRRLTGPRAVSRTTFSTKSTRPATFEQLEPRHLLAGNTLAAIAGTAYTDVTNNGLTSDDTVLQNVTVRLFRDGANSVFDGGNGSGDDTLVGSTSTDGNGNYRFVDIAPGRYFVQQAAVAGRIMQPAADVVEVVVSEADLGGVIQSPIDTFETPQAIDASSLDSRTSASSAAAPEAIGAERDLYLELTSPYGKLQLISNPGSQSLLEFNSTAGADGIRLVTWDGPDGDALTFDPVGLNGYDITESGTVEGIQFSFGADHSAGRLFLRVYSDASNWSTASVDIARTGGAGTAPVVIMLQDFVPSGGRGADFTNVGAIQLAIEGDEAIDGQIQRLDTFGPKILRADFANLQPLSLGNLVWFDANNNGNFDAATEQGIGGVTLNLLADSDGNGVFSPGVDRYLASDTTDNAGHYRFGDLLPGDYVVQVDPSNLAPGGALEGLVLTTGAVATDPDNDVNNDNNGLTMAGQGVVSRAITLSAGDEPVDDEDTSAYSNLTVDVGFTLFDLSISKQDDPDPALAGQVLTYTLLVTNHGPADAAGVTVVDPLPAGVTYRSDSASQGTTRLDGGSVVADLGDLAAGQSATVTIIVDVAADFRGTLFNEATVSGRRDTVVAVANDPWREVNLSNNRDDQLTQINQKIDLAIVKSDNPDVVLAGEALTYTLTVTNNGPAVATGVTAVDTLPAGVDYRSSAASQGSTSHSGSTVTASLGTLAPGATASVSIVVDVHPDVVGTLFNTAVVRGNEDDTNPSNDSDTEDTPVINRIDLSVVKSDDPDPVVAGEQLTYTLLVTNHGPSTATGTTVTDELPDRVQFKSVTTSQGTAAHALGHVTASVGTLAPGASATISIVVDVDSTATEALHNSAVVTANENDINPQNDADTEITSLTRKVDLSVVKTDSPDPVVAGEQLVYSLVVTNGGPSTATGVTLVDALPADVQFKSVSASQGAASNNLGTVTANLGTLAAGESATVTIMVDVLSGAADTLTNVATVSANEDDVNPTNNTDDEITLVRSVFDLQVLKTDSIDPVVAGEQLTYTLLVTNNGPSDATDVVVIDDLPGEVSYVSSTTSRGTVGFENGRVTADLGYMATGDSATVTILVEVGLDVVGRIDNMAVVEGKPVHTNPELVGLFLTELNLDNNVDEQQTLVEAALSTISGFVFVDLDDDGIRDPEDKPIPDVPVRLSGENILGATLDLTDLTDDDGKYEFVDLLPGVYTVSETQPTQYNDGKDAPGRLRGSSTPLTYSVRDDVFADIGLGGGVDAIEFNFGELSQFVSKRDFLSST